MGKTLEEQSEYISLQEATKYCDYSQEYLSLRARQGKLKSVKFGRNWVTKREWLEEYISKNGKPETPSFQQILRPSFRYAILGSLVFILLGAGIVFGKNSIINFAEDVSENISKSTDIIGEIVSEKVLEFSEGLVTISIPKVSLPDISIPEISIPKVSLPKVSLPKVSGSEISATVSDTFNILTYEINMVANEINMVANRTGNRVADRAADIGQTTGQGFNILISEINRIGKDISKNYLAADNFVEQKIVQGWQNTSDNYLAADKFVEKKIVQGWQNIIHPWKKTSEKIVVEKSEKIIEKEIIVKEVEVSRITKVEPIKEITKEKVITKIDDEELTKLKTQLSIINKELSIINDWETDIDELRNITKKLQSRPTATYAASAPIYIASQGLQVGGTGTFASLGVSGSAGVGNLGVGGSTSLGSTSSDRLTVNATSTFNAAVTFASLASFATVNITELKTPYAQTKTVAKSGADYTTIQAAIDSLTCSAASPCLVRVMPGIYEEAITLADYVDVISSAGPETTFIQQATATIITAGASNCRVSGFTINKTTDDTTSAISLLTYSPTLKDLIIIGAGTTNQTAIDITTGSPRINNARISNVNIGINHTGVSGITTIRFSTISALNDIYASGDGATIICSNNILQSSANNFKIDTGAVIESSNDKYGLVNNDGVFRDLSQTRIYTEAVAGVNVGEIVYLSTADTVDKAKADSTSTMPTIGIVVKKSGTQVWVKTSGIYYEHGASWTSGSSYYVSASTPGALTLTEPAGEISQIIGIAKSGEEFILMPIGGGSGGETGSFQNVLTVSHDGANFSTIQAAIDAVSSPSDSNRWLILVYPNVYDEAITLDENYTDLIGIGGPEVTKIMQADATVLTVTSNNNRIQGFNFDISADTDGKTVVALNTSPDTVTLEDIKITWAGTGTSTGIAVITGSPQIKRAVITQVAKAITITSGSPTITQSDITATDIGVSITTGGGAVTLTYNTINATNDDIKADSITSATIINTSNNWLRSSVNNFDINTNATVNSYKDTYTIVNDNSSAGTFNQKDYVRNDTLTGLIVSQTGAGVAAILGDGTDYLQISNVGDLVFVDADDGASITGPAGGSLAIAAGASQALILNAQDTSNFTVTGSDKSLTLLATGGGAQRLILQSAGTGTDAIYLNASAGGLDIDASGGMTINTNNTADINFDSNTLVIDTSANTVGIGTATPGSKLDILDNSSNTALTVRQSGDGNIVDFKDGSDVIVSVEDAGRTVFSGRVPDTIEAPTGTGVAQGVVYITAPSGISTYGSRTLLGIGRDGASETAGNREIFRVDANGNVYARSLTLSGSTSTGSMTVTGDFEQTSGMFTIGGGLDDTLNVKSTATFTGPLKGILDISALSTPAAATGVAQISGGSMADADYYYVIAATNSTGETVKGAQSSAITISGGSGSGSVDLIWSAIPGATGYKIFRTTTTGDYSTPSLIAAITATSAPTYTDTAASAGAGTPQLTNSTGGKVAITTSGTSGTALTVTQTGTGVAGIFGDGTDYLQISNVGDLVFVDADDGAAITGPAGGALDIIGGASATSLTLAGYTENAQRDVIISTVNAAGAAQVTRMLFGSDADQGASLITLYEPAVIPSLKVSDLTSGYVTFAGASGELVDDSNFTFATDTLTVTKIGAFEATGAINFDSQNMTNVDIDSGTVDAITSLTVDADLAFTGAQAITTSSGDLTLNPAASLNITLTVDDADAFDLANDNASYYLIDTRNTVKGVTAHLFDTEDAGFAAAADGTYTLADFPAYTLTYTGAVGVTDLVSSVKFGSTTLTHASALAVSKATTIEVSPTIEGTLTLTNASAIRILNAASGTPTTQTGLYIEDLTAGTNDYGIYIAGADTAAIYVAADGITIAGGGMAVTGNILANDAAGPAFIDEAATATNPTLIPNRADETTGIGWNTNELHFVVAGVDEVNLSATALSPGVSDGTALGTTALMWSDLFLASGGVVNFNSGDVTLTHSANTLTFGGGTLAMGTNDITLTGSIGRDVDNELNWGTDNSLAIVINGVTSNIVSISTGTGNNDKLITQGYADDEIDSHIATVDTWSEILAGGNTSGGTDVIVSNGDGLVVGHTGQVIFAEGTYETQILGTTAADTGLALGLWSETDALAPTLRFMKSGHATIGAANKTIVANNELLGGIIAYGADGVDLATQVAEIQFNVDDASPEAGHIGGELIFLTSTEGAAGTLTTALTISAAQKATFAGAIDAGGNVVTGGTYNTATITGGALSGGTISGASLSNTQLQFTGAASISNATGGTSLTIYGGDDGVNAGEDIIIVSENWNIGATGIITTATWQGGVVGTTYGGTGVSSFGGVNTILYTTSANTLSNITTANSSVLVTSAGGVPSLSTTLPAFTAGGHIIPSGDSSYDLGSSGPKYFANAYIDKIWLNSTATLEGTTSAGLVNLTGNLTTSGTLTVNGNTTLGNAAEDTITLTGSINADVNFLDAATGVAYTITGSDATTAANAGGSLTIKAGAGLTTGAGGNLVLVAGSVGTGGSPGYIDFQTWDVNLDTPALATMMEIGNPNIKLNRPLSVNVGGDVGIDYDLAFLSTGTSYITSQGPMTIAAGDPNHAENLILTTRSASEADTDTGTCTASAATTLDDSTKAWTADEWIGGTIRITSGYGSGQYRRITDNTTTQITVSANWTFNPSTNSKYSISKMAGDVVVDVRNSNLTSGGFKVLGTDSSGYIFRVSPFGDVEVGGNGSGSGNLTIKGDILIRGKTQTHNQLSAPTFTTSPTVNDAGSLSGSVSTYYYVVTSIDANGETAPSVTKSQALTPITAPTASTATLVVTGTGVVDNGTHKYKITFVNANGETSAGDVSNTVTVDDTHKQVDLTAIPTAGAITPVVTDRKIYRTKAGLDVYYLLHTIEDNVGTTYTDNTADADLGVEVPATNTCRTDTNTITISWGAIAGVTTGYKLYRGTDDDWTNSDDRLVDNAATANVSTADNGAGDSAGQVNPPTTDASGGTGTMASSLIAPLGVTQVDNKNSADPAGGAGDCPDTTGVTRTYFATGDISGTVSIGDIIQNQTKTIQRRITAVNTCTDGGGTGRTYVDHDTITGSVVGNTFDIITPASVDLGSWSNPFGDIFARRLYGTHIDVAEIFPVRDLDTRFPEEGDIVAIDLENPETMVVSTSPYQKNLAGIISTNPGLLLGGKISKTQKPVALAGRVPVKVSATNGEIAIGDSITSSSLPGIGMKATETGRIIGWALESWDGGETGEDVKRIICFVNLSSLYVGSLAIDGSLNEGQSSSGGGLTSTDSTGGQSSSGGGLTSITSQIQQALVSLGIRMENGIAYIQEIITDKLTAKTARLEKLEMVDQSTGQIYCTWIENGEWVKHPGECAISNQSSIITDNEVISDNLPLITDGGQSSSGGGLTSTDSPDDSTPEQPPAEEEPSAEVISNEVITDGGQSSSGGGLTSTDSPDDSTPEEEPPVEVINNEVISNEPDPDPAE